MKAPLPFLPVLSLLFVSSPATFAADGDTQVLKWKDGKKACFLLGFDDSAPSQLKNVVPELQKRKIVGTFYLVTGNGVWAGTKAKWEEAAKSPYIVVANHTFTHKGINSADEIEPELAKCNDVLYSLQPERKQPYLMAWGKPGGVPWIISKDDQEAALKKHNLVDRPPFAGPPINYKTQEQTLAAVDQALEKGEMGYLVFHGVGGDWLVTPTEWFIALLDKLEQHRDEIWITDCASWKKYTSERDTAEVKLVEHGNNRLRLNLTAKTDPTLYDEPLTLTTKLPANWKTCTVTQGQAKASATVQDGAARYSAIPGAGEIVLQP